MKKLFYSIAALIVIIMAMSLFSCQKEQENKIGISVTVKMPPHSTFAGGLVIRAVEGSPIITMGIKNNFLISQYDLRFFNNNNSGQARLTFTLYIRRDSLIMAQKTLNVDLPQTNKITCDFSADTIMWKKISEK